MSGGSGHRSQSNSESSKARNNRMLIDDLLDDLASGEKITDVFIGKVVKRLGNGRMSVFYTQANGNAIESIIPIRGGLKGKSKKDVWIDIESIVMIAETGLGGVTHEIVAVLSPAQVSKYKKLCPQADPRIFQKGSNIETEKQEEAFEFDAKEDDEVEVNVDDI